MKSQGQEPIRFGRLRRIHPNRETWLEAAVEAVASHVLDTPGTRAASVRVSCGWPSRSPIPRAGATSRRIGECWHPDCSADGTREIFISPALDHPVEVLGTLLHELIHAYLPEGTGHGPEFRRAAKAVGLGGKPTATVVDDDSALAEALVELLHTRLGDYPHRALDRSPGQRRKPSSSRVFCPVCHYTVRTARGNLRSGVPQCACGTTMVADEEEASGADELLLVDTITKWRTDDMRFEVLAVSRGRKAQFTVIDCEAPGSPPARLRFFKSRSEALAFIAAVRDGSFTWPPIVAETERGWDFLADEDGLGPANPE